MYLHILNHKMEGQRGYQHFFSHSKSTKRRYWNHHLSSLSRFIIMIFSNYIVMSVYIFVSRVVVKPRKQKKDS